MLRRLLTALSKQQTQGRFTFSVRVVDNDRSASAKGVIDMFCRNNDLVIDYAVEPRQNIALARNLAVAGASGEYIALIDDDEWPVSDWLYLLLATIIRMNADGALGPVLPELANDAPRWLAKSGLCERPSHPTGKWLSYEETRTGNVLLRRVLFRSGEQYFRPELGEGGGEDIDFFRRKAAEGYKFVWCNEAAAYEIVPEERWELDYYCRRQLRLGGLLATRTKQAGTLTVVDVSRSFARLLLKLARTLMRLPFGRAAYARPLVRACYDAGFVFGAMGVLAPRKREELRHASEHA